ncbi:Rabenosyn-5 [Trichoplax sp. H2]|nr:Rabenosyn-5 [Trichoplax sp. H2]|eukprot:RDD45999.1 Rabenosyn-5 [Trichoplax sp. H2]
MEADMKEGFLCPECKKDLTSAELLLQHVTLEHGKTKGKVLPVFNEIYYDDDRFYKQEIGLINRVTEEFRRLRNQSIDHGFMETNKLVFRLEKLLKSLNEVSKVNPLYRKAAEKKVVPWTQDDDVSACQCCGKSFNITRRRHHCRLCGVVICAKCSYFILVSTAKYLVEPTASSRASNNQKDDESEPFRVCPNCNVRLSRYMQHLKEKFESPVILVYYEKMKENMDSITKGIPDYEKMAKSLSAGGSEYSLEVAANLRVKLLKLFEQIDGISKKIAVLDVDMADSATLFNSASEKLRRGIRQFATKFLQDKMLTLPGLPTEEELNNLQRQRKAVIQRKIELERAENLVRAEYTKNQASMSPDRGESTSRVEFSKNQHSVAVKSDINTNDSFQRRRVASKNDTNHDWVVRGSISAPSEDVINVWEEQAKNLRKYIEIARSEGKYDDVASLERNLSEIQAEIMNQ